MGVLVPKSRGGNAVAPVVGLPQIQAEESGLAPAAAGLRQASADLANVADKVRRQEDEVRVTDALTLAERQWQNSLYAADGGLLQRRGVNALEGPDRKSVIDDGLERRQQILDEAMGTLTTPRQRTALKTSMASRDRFAIDTLQRHMEREREVYRDSVSESSIAVHQEALALAGNDVERSVAVAEIARATAEMAARKGLSPEATDVMIREFTTAPLEGSITALARTDPEAAAAMFEDRKQFIRADRHGVITKAIEFESKTIQSQDLTEAAFAANPGGSLAQIQKWIRANSKGEVEDDALGRASSRWQVEDAARRDGAERASAGLDAGVWSFMSRPASERTPQATAAYRDELQRQIRDQGLDVAAGTSLLRNFDMLTAGGTIETDPMERSRLWNLAATDPAAFAKENLPAVRHLFDRTDFSEINQLQKDVRSGLKPSAASPSGLGALEVAKKVAKDAGVSDEEWEAQFELRAHRAIQAREENLGRSLTYAEREEAATDVLDAYPVPDGPLWFVGSKPIGEWTAKDRREAITNPPADLVTTMRGKLAERGITNPTDEQLLEDIEDFLDLNGVPRE